MCLEILRNITGNLVILDILPEIPTGNTQTFVNNKKKNRPWLSTAVCTNIAVLDSMILACIIFAVLSSSCVVTSNTAPLPSANFHILSRTSLQIFLPRTAFKIFFDLTFFPNCLMVFIKYDFVVKKDVVLKLEFLLLLGLLWHFHWSVSIPW